MVTVYRGHRRTLFYLSGIISLFIICIGISRNNSLVGTRARARSNPCHWALHALLHMASECVNHSATRAGCTFCDMMWWWWWRWWWCDRLRQSVSVWWGTVSFTRSARVQVCRPWTSRPLCRLLPAGIKLDFSPLASPLAGPTHLQVGRPFVCCVVTVFCHVIKAVDLYNALYVILISEALRHGPMWVSGL